MNNVGRTMAGTSATFTALDTYDVRFPTSRWRHGSDAMNPDPDYSAAYVVLRTDRGDGLQGHGFAFTIGRGNEVQLAAIRAIAPLVVGRSVDEALLDMGAFWQRLRSDSQLRWLGPDKGVLQMAVAAVTNAAWDIFAKTAGKPLWKLLADLSPEAIVDLVDFRYLSDALTRDEALAMLRRNAGTKAQREAHVRVHGYPAYTTSPGWLGYTDEQLREACSEAVRGGFEFVKIKIARDFERDLRRCSIAREALGSSRKLMLDANQYWSVDEAISTIPRFAQFDPWWIEEPTHPDDVVGHARIASAVAPIRIATGEHAANSIVFKQLLQQRAIGVAQIDACRSGGVNDVVATMLMAAKFGVPVCPHAGGVGLCELAQHLAIFDYIAVSTTMENRVLEYVDHLHEHFIDPVTIRNGRYVVPETPGFSSELEPSSIAQYLFPNGSAWSIPAQAS
ncbi:MAG: enolase C-terminal domain-like protein [Vulcanimicrobiaceae bacterium]